MVQLTDQSFQVKMSESFHGLMKNSPKILIYTKDDAEISVRSSLFTVFSKYLGPCLSAVPCCTTPTLFLPDFSSSTVHRFIEILTNGVSKNPLDEVGISEVINLAVTLGIGFENTQVVTNDETHPKADKKNEQPPIPKKKTVYKIITKPAVKVNVPTKTLQSTTNEVDNDGKIDGNDSEDETVVNYAKKLEEELSKMMFRGQEKTGNVQPTQTKTVEEPAQPIIKPVEQISALDDTITVSDKTCAECHKQLPSVSLLGYHYCKHFLESLKNPKFFSMYDDKKCLKCDQSFYDRTTLLSHIGVKHELINDILRFRGVTPVAFWKIKSRKMANVKKEAHSVCEPSLPAAVEKSVNKNVKQEQLSMNKSVNESHKCEVCAEAFTSQNKLAQHACSHFLVDLKCFSELYEGNSCKPCDTAYSTEFALMIHLGLKHQKINDVLKAHGYKPLVIQTVNHRANLNPGNNTSIESPSYSLLTSASNSTLSESSCYDESSQMERSSSSTVSHSETESIISDMNTSSSTDMNTSIKENENLTFRPTVNSTPAICLRKQSSLLAKPSAKGEKKGKKKKYPCEICDKECNYPGNLGQHYCDSHFTEDLKLEVSKKFDGKQCRDCLRTVRSDLDQIRHAGMKHGLVNILLEKQGLKSVAFKFYKYNNPSIKLAAQRQAASNRFVDETIPEESIDDLSIGAGDTFPTNGSSSGVDTTDMDTTDDDVSNIEQSSLMIKTDLCSISKQMETDESSSSVNDSGEESFTAEDTTFTDEDQGTANEGTVTDEDFTAAIEMDTTGTEDETTSEEASPKILETFSLNENGFDIDGKLLVSD